MAFLFKSPKIPEEERSGYMRARRRAFSGPLMALMLSKRLLLSVYAHSVVAAARAATSASGVCVKSHFVWALALSTPASAMMLKSIFFMAFYFLLNFTI